MIDEYRPRLSLLAGATLISFSPVLVKVALAHGLGATATAFWRTGIGATALVLLCLMRKENLVVAPRVFGFAGLAGLVFAADLFAWHRSIAFVGAGVSTVLGNLQVFVTAIAAVFIFRERVTPSFFVAASAALGGVTLLVGIGNHRASEPRDYLIGVFLGLATAMAYAGYLICLKLAALHHSHPPAIVIVSWASAFASLFLGLFSLFEPTDWLPTNARAAIAVVALGIAVQAIAWALITSALPRVPTAQAGLILLLQPALAVIWGVAMFDEQLSLLQTAGVGMTLVAMYFGGLRRTSS